MLFPAAGARSGILTVSPGHSTRLEEEQPRAWSLRLFSRQPPQAGREATQVRVWSESDLSSLFSELVERNFFQLPAVCESSVTAYVASLLADFARVENLYKIRDARGRPLEDVGEMLIESNPLLEAPSFDRERQVRKHIGDFTLFFTGMFPESIRRWRLRQQRLESFVDYMKAGKESYDIVAAFNQFEYRKVAPLFRRLSEHFETCVYGLNLVRRELDFGRPRLSQQIREILD